MISLSATSRHKNRPALNLRSQAGPIERKIMDTEYHSHSSKTITLTRPPLRLPADCIEILCHGGFDQLTTEACMIHLIHEYEPYAEDCGMEGRGDDAN
jgi:hypothetical protein